MKVMSCQARPRPMRAARAAAHEPTPKKSSTMAGVMSSATKKAAPRINQSKGAFIISSVRPAVCAGAVCRCFACLARRGL